MANTGLGTFITKVGLLAGTGWGLSSLLKVTHIIPVITSQFSNLATVIGMIGNPAVVSSIGGIGTALSAVGGFAGIALPALLGISAALVGIITLANALEENAHKAEKQLQDLRTQIDEMEDPASEYSNLKSRVDELTESEKIRLGVLQSQLDTLKEQEEVISRQQLAKWQKGQVEDQTTYVTNYDDYGYGVTEAYTYNQAADSLNNFREAYLNLERDKKNGQISNSEYVSSLQSLIDKNQTTITNLRDLKTAYEETGDATYKLNEDQEKFLLWADAASEKLATNATNVANAVQAEQDAADGLEDAMSQIEVATYDTSTAAAQLTASLFDQNGQLTTAGLQALSVDSSMRSLATSELQAQQAAAQANYANLILEIQKVGSAAMITAGQLSQMMALAGVDSAQGLVGGLASGASTDIEGLKSAFFRSFGKSADANVADFNKWVSSRVSSAGQSTYDKIMEETQKRLDELEKNFPSGVGGGGGSRKSAEEKAAEEAEKQAKKAQQAQEKAAKESQSAYESAAKSAEQAAQEAARAAEQAAEEAKQKILDTISELKSASDKFWESKTDAVEETNKELDRQKQLEEKLKALEEAKQKKILLYKNGQFQYDKDYGTIAKAQADYEETRDKIQRERELEQLQEMKDNATEIFNEMKDIISNGGNVTQSMINSWLSQMQSDGADYYESNKAILSDWLTWAQGAITEFSQSAVDAIYKSTSSLMSSGTYGSNASSGGSGSLIEGILEYMQDPKYRDANGEFVGLASAFWIDRFEEQIKRGNFGDYTEAADWLGKTPGSSIFDDWQEVLKYWAVHGSGGFASMPSAEANKDMVDRLVAAKIVGARYKDIFASLGYDDIVEKLDKLASLDVNEVIKSSQIAGAISHPEDPFGFRSIEGVDPNTAGGKLYSLLQDIADYELYTGSGAMTGRGADYKKMSIAGDLRRTAKLSEWYQSTTKTGQRLNDDGSIYTYFEDVRDAAYDVQKLEKFFKDNESMIDWLSNVAYYQAKTPEEQQAIHLEAEARRQAREYAGEILGYDTEGIKSQTEAEREANRTGGRTMLEAKQNRKTNENIAKIQNTLDDANKGRAMTDKYIQAATDYLGKVIDENAKKILESNSEADKKSLETQNAQLELMQEQLKEKEGTVNTTGTLPWEDTTFEDYDPTEDLMAIQEKMKANSKAWFDADEETRKKLHEENVRLAKQVEDLSDTRMTYEGHTGKWTQTARNANGTHNFRGGLSIVGENGPELRVLGRGDSIIPADKTENLWKWASLTPNSMLAAIGNRSSKAGDVSYGFNISNLQLPNVTDAKSFVQGLKNYALQYSYKR